MISRCDSEEAIQYYTSVRTLMAKAFLDYSSTPTQILSSLLQETSYLHHQTRCTAKFFLHFWSYRIHNSNHCTSKNLHPRIMMETITLGWTFKDKLTSKWTAIAKNIQETAALFLFRDIIQDLASQFRWLSMSLLMLALRHMEQLPTHSKTIMSPPYCQKQE